MLCLRKSAPRVNLLFHSCCESTVVRKKLLLQSVSHQPQQKALNPDYVMGVVGQFRQDWQCAPQSSNLHEIWSYCAARER